MFDKKVGSTMNSTIDRRRIFIFVVFAYAIFISLALLIFFSPRALAPAAGPRPVEPKAVQETAHGAAI